MSVNKFLPKRHQPTSMAQTVDIEIPETRLLLEDPEQPEMEVSASSSDSLNREAKIARKADTALMNSDYLFIKLVARLALSVLRRFWAFSSMAILAVILFYWLCGGIMAFLLVIFAFTGIIYHASDFILYQPNAPNTSRVFVPAPSILGLDFESVFIKTRDRIRIHLFLIKHPTDSEQAPTILFLHGNAGNIGHRLPNVKGLVKEVGCNICLLEYRGYGRSDGSPSEEGLYMDAQAGLDYLSSRSDINQSRIIVFGRSLGGAVAIEMAARAENREKIRGCLIENSFTSVPDVARSAFNVKLIRILPNLLFKNQFRSRAKVCRISAPILFLSGADDQLIPPKMMNELFSSCGSETKRLVQFNKGAHNDTWMCKDYYSSIKYFIEEIAGIRPPQTINIHPPTGFIQEASSVI